MMRYFVILVLWCVAIKTELLAQTETRKDTTQLPEVIISANRVQLKLKDSDRIVNVITHQQIKNLPVQSIADVLGYVAGVDIQQRGPLGVQADVSLRGATFNQTQILINGIMVNDAQTGHHNLDIPLQLEDIERIEVLKGPASKVFGQNAFAGAINIITKVDDVKNAHTHTTGGDFGYYDVGTSIQMPIGNYKQLLSLNRRGANDYINSTNTYARFAKELGKKNTQQKI